MVAPRTAAKLSPLLARLTADQSFLFSMNSKFAVSAPLMIARPLLLQVLLQGYVSLASGSGNSVAQKVISRRSPSWNPPAARIHRSAALRLRFRGGKGVIADVSGGTNLYCVFARGGNFPIKVEMIQTEKTDAACITSRRYPDLQVRAGLATLCFYRNSGTGSRCEVIELLSSLRSYASNASRGSVRRHGQGQPDCKVLIRRNRAQRKAITCRILVSPCHNAIDPTLRQNFAAQIVTAHLPIQAMVVRRKNIQGRNRTLTWANAQIYDFSCLRVE